MFFISASSVGTSFQLPYFVVIFRVASGNGMSWAWHIAHTEYLSVFVYQFSHIQLLFYRSLSRLFTLPTNSLTLHKKKKKKTEHESDSYVLSAHWFTCVIAQPLPLLLLVEVLLLMLLYSNFYSLCFFFQMLFLQLCCVYCFVPQFHFSSSFGFFWIQYVLEIGVYAWQFKKGRKKLKQKNDHSVEKFATLKCMIIMIV